MSHQLFLLCGGVKAVLIMLSHHELEDVGMVFPH